MEIKSVRVNRIIIAKCSSKFKKNADIERQAIFLQTRTDVCKLSYIEHVLTTTKKISTVWPYQTL